MAGDVSRNPASTLPLRREQLARLLSQLDPGRFEDVYVLLILHAGMHPSVLADPRAHGLGIEGGTDLIWRRPKTRAFMRVPLPPEIARIAPLFLDGIHPCNVRSINRMVHHAGERAGIPELTPRALRHTFILQVLRFTDNNINEAIRLGGCTAAQALAYARTLESEADPLMRGSSMYGKRPARTRPLSSYDGA